MFSGEEQRGDMFSAHRARFETCQSPPGVFFSAEEPREETLIYDVDVVKVNAMRKSKNTGQIL